MESNLLETLFTGVLRLSAKAGLVKVGVVDLDGTKIKANAALDATAPDGRKGPGEQAIASIADG